MPLTWGDILQWHPAALDSAEAALRAARSACTDRAGDLDAMATPKGWSGDAADNASVSLRRLRGELRDLVAQVSAAYTAVRDAADGVRGVESAVRTALDHAHAGEFSIDADGTVRDLRPPMCLSNTHDGLLIQQERQDRLGECALRVEAALRKAADVDADLGAVLAKILAGTIKGGDGSLGAAAASGEAMGRHSVLPPPGHGSPAENAAWWASLSADEREEVIGAHPEWIGNRDGVEFAARDRANRLLLDRRRVHVDERWAILERFCHDENGRFIYGNYLQVKAEYEDLKEERESIATLGAILARPGAHALLGLDFTTERTQAIVANGDVDHADHVAVFTPGLTSTVAGMGGYDSDMAALKLRTEGELFRRGEQGTVATVTWLGYQAPQWSTIFTSNSVASSGAAEAGGASLANFYRGMNAARPTDPDLTALGHSYGSTTTGYALQQAGVDVDRAIFFGSPGLGTSSLDTLAIRSGAAYYAEAKWDGVGDLAAFGADPTGMKGMQHLQTGAATTPDGRAWEGIIGHLDYLKDGSTSQYSMAQVVGGHPDSAVHGKNVGWATDPISAQDWYPEWLK